MTLLTLLQGNAAATSRHGARTLIIIFPGAIRLYGGSVVGAFLLLLLLPS